MRIPGKARVIFDIVDIPVINYAIGHDKMQMRIKIQRISKGLYGCNDAWSISFDDLAIAKSFTECGICSLYQIVQSISVMHKIRAQ